jgi:hypothetical protein
VAAATLRVYEVSPFGDRLVDSAVFENAALEFGGAYVCQERRPAGSAATGSPAGSGVLAWRRGEGAGAVVV